jgi:hypothetical protein
MSCEANRSGVGSSQLDIMLRRERGGTMVKPIAERWRAWRDPQARQARKARRRREWNEAQSEAEAESRRQWHAPSPTEAWTKNTKR